MTVAKLVVENFRAFKGRVEIPFGPGDGTGDPLVVLHGRNGTGKTTAQVALALVLWLRVRVTTMFGTLKPSGTVRMTDGELVHGVRVGLAAPSAGDFARADAPATRFELHGVDSRLGVFRVRVIRVERDAVAVDYKLESDPLDADPSHAQRLHNEWFGQAGVVGSKLIDAIDSRRMLSWLVSRPDVTLLQATLAEALFDLRVARESEPRAQWRRFTEQLRRFAGFESFETSVDRIQVNAPPVLTFEKRGELVLALADLSSGEQQLVSLLAAILLSPAAILSIQEPELNLDAENQKLLRVVLDELVQQGIKDQIFIESHVPNFDGPEVVRFERTNGIISARRGTGGDGAEEARIQQQAKAAQGGPFWVTREGYAQLPPEMLRTMELTAGGRVWFVPGTRPRVWEAWRQDDLVAAIDGTEAPGTGES